MKIRLQILNTCSIYDHETAWKQTRKAGNTTLLNENTDYEHWKSQNESSTLVFTGKLGAGKSVLLANIVDDLYLHAKNQNIIVTYFFCRYNLPESLEARTIFGSLARQLLRATSDTNTITKIVEWSNTALDFDEILKLLRLSFPTKRKVYFVLDGLDECDAVDQVTLLDYVCDLQKILPLLLCVSARPEPERSFQVCSEHFPNAWFTSIPDLNHDLGTFIETELEACITSKRLVVGDPNIALEIQDALVAGSQGMFLWVALQIASLCSMESDYAIRQALADLPKDLSEAFSRTLQKPERS